MNDIRARFEEIWPVPESIYWSDRHGQYMIKDGRGSLADCLSYEAKLEIFTRCQETTDVYVSLVDELICELECMTATFYTPSSDEVLDRAKQIMGDKK